MLQSSQRISSVRFLFPGTAREKGSLSGDVFTCHRERECYIMWSNRIDLPPAREYDPIELAAVGSVRTRPTLRANKHRSVKGEK